MLVYVEYDLALVLRGVTLGSKKFDEIRWSSISGTQKLWILSSGW